MTARAIDPKLMGIVWPSAHPGEDRMLYGSVEIDPKGPFEARSFETITLTYTAGRYGLDDTGAVRVVFRLIGDAGKPQMEDPRAVNYTTAVASNGAKLGLQFHGRGSQRPFNKALDVNVTGGYLREGDTLTITLGDRSGGSPGFQMQTFCEAGAEMKFLADVCATGHFMPVAEGPAFDVIAGAPALWRAVLPSLRRPGESFHFGLKAEDAWGNPTGQAKARLRLQPTSPIQGLPDEVVYGPDQRSMIFEGLMVTNPGLVSIRVFDDGDGLLATSNPLLIEDRAFSGYWADLHGQSGESIGIGASLDYFHFARDCAFLDAVSHQANDFQVNNAFWGYLNELTAKFHEDHRFVTFPGYEWSGNTGVGGDRNVYFRQEGRQIHRSSHALLPDRDDIETDAPTATDLFKAIADEDCVVYAHVGGRYADIAYAHDPKLEHSMEIHSAWGTFEWLITDAFDLGYRCGVVCNSDGHKGRPGASYPGASTFGAYGGLTCFFAEELTRDGLFECLRRRHHYGTTGNRLHLEVHANFESFGELFERDPAVFDCDGRRVKQVMMGDIARTNDDAVTVSVRAISASPIERIEVRNGKQVVETVRGYDSTDLGSRIRVIWSGATYRGRDRQVEWHGSVRFHNCEITKMAKINAWNHEKLLEQVGHDTVYFDALTTGNFGGFDVWLEEGADAVLDIGSNMVSGRFPLSDIGIEDTVLDAGGLDCKIRAFRLPNENPHVELTADVDVALHGNGDNPLWICLTTEDGFQAWSSPVYIFRN
jgi:hypothetical protein